MLAKIVITLLLALPPTAWADDDQIVDADGLTIPTSPTRQPYVMINGFPNTRSAQGTF